MWMAIVEVRRNVACSLFCEPAVESHHCLTGEPREEVERDLYCCQYWLLSQRGLHFEEELHPLPVCL